MNNRMYKDKSSKAVIKRATYNSLRHWRHNLESFPSRADAKTKLQWFREHCKGINCALCKLFEYKCSDLCPLKDYAKKNKCCYEWKTALYASRLKRAFKILYATGAEPNLSNKLIIERYNRFYERVGIKATPMRFRNIDFEQFVVLTDCIFCIGELSAFSFESYKKYNNTLYQILPSTSPLVRFLPSWRFTFWIGFFFQRHLAWS